MADNPKNQESGSRGGSIILDVIFYSPEGTIVDPDNNTANYVIKNPSETIVQSGIGTRTDTGKYQITYLIAADAEVSDRWNITWSAEINGNPITDSEVFTVEESSALNFGDVVIENRWLNLIKAVQGFPKVENLVLTNDEIKAYAVFPAMHDYFIKFPIKTRVQVPIGNGAELDVDFPSDKTFGVTHASVVGKLSGTSASGNNFWNDWYYNNMFGGSRYRKGAYGTKYNFYQTRQAQWMHEQEINTLMNKATFKYFVDHTNRQLKIYSSVSAEVAIEWASFSDDFNDVLYTRRRDVIQLAQGYLLLHFSDLTSIGTSGAMDVEIGTDEMKERGQGLIDAVMEKWNEWPDVIYIRMA